MGVCSAEWWDQGGLRARWKAESHLTSGHAFDVDAWQGADDDFASRKPAEVSRQTRQDPALVARVCALGREGRPLRAIDEALHGEGFVNTKGKPWPAKSDGSVLKRILAAAGVPVTEAGASISCVARLPVSCMLVCEAPWSIGSASAHALADPRSPAQLIPHTSLTAALSPCLHVVTPASHGMISFSHQSAYGPRLFLDR